MNVPEYRPKTHVSAQFAGQKQTNYSCHGVLSKKTAYFRKTTEQQFFQNLLAPQIVLPRINLKNSGANNATPPKNIKIKLRFFCFGFDQ
jgi:hypothetical protein